MAARYEPLPTSPLPDELFSPASSSPTSPTYPPPYEANDLERRPRRRPDPIPAFDSDPRFRVRTPSPLTRGALLLFIAFLFWLAFNMRRALWIENGMGMGHAPVEEVDPSY